MEKMLKGRKQAEKESESENSSEDKCPIAKIRHE